MRRAHALGAAPGPTPGCVLGPAPGSVLGAIPACIGNDEYIIY